MTDKTIGHFQILKEIGHGGMGSVYLARSLESDAQVALKVVPEFMSKRTEFKGRFERECEALRILDHPGIPRFIEQGVIEGKMYAAMELVEGISLDEVLETQHQRVTFELINSIVRRVAEILGYAHSVGIFHRDLSLRNILISDTDELYVIDFGLAKVVNEITLTVTGQHFGTPIYMSPDHFGPEGAKAADHRADLWSLGVIAFRMATGRMPFVASNDVNLIGFIAHPDVPVPSPLEIVSYVPERLAEVIGKLLQKDPKHRYQNAAEVISRLDQSEEIPPVEAFLPTRQYNIGDLVYLSAIKRWAVVSKKESADGREYVRLNHQDSRWSPRVCNQTDHDLSEEVFGDNCSECGGRRSQYGFCSDCGLSFFGSPDSLAIVETRASSFHLREDKEVAALTSASRSGSMATWVIGAFGAIVIAAGGYFLSSSLLLKDKTISAAAEIRPAEYDSEGRININTASSEVLAQLSGFGQADNQNVVFAHRLRKGAYTELGELPVGWMSSTQRDNLEKKITFGDKNTVWVPPDFESNFQEVDINHAGISELTSVPYLSEKSALAIIEERESNGPFTDIDDVAKRVKGIGKSTGYYMDGFLVFGAILPSKKKPSSSYEYVIRSFEIDGKTITSVYDGKWYRYILADDFIVVNKPRQPFYDEYKTRARNNGFGYFRDKDKKILGIIIGNSRDLIDRRIETGENAGTLRVKPADQHLRPGLAVYIVETKTDKVAREEVDPKIRVIGTLAELWEMKDDEKVRVVWPR